MNDEAPRHPGAQTMAAFLDGKLPRNEIAAVTDHLGECADCRTVVAETARFEREEEPRAESPRRARRWRPAAAAVVAAAALTIPLIQSRVAPDPIARLVDAAPADHRLLEPRLARFRWAPLQPPPRGTAVPTPSDLQLNGTAGDILQKTLDRTDARAQHASGVAYLLIGQAKESIAALDRAAQASNDWQPWNDVAAARYAAATGEKRPSLFPQALADADQALRLAPNAAEAHFNRALILEALGLQDAARDAWERYLALDPSSGWSNEARVHLRRLQPRSTRFDPGLFDTLPPDALVRQFPQEARRRAETILLNDWANAEKELDRARANVLLARARAIGDALARVNSERMLADAVAAIERADPAARAALADAQRTYYAARGEHGKRLPSATEQQFRRAADLFRRHGSPMGDLAQYYAATAVLGQGRVQEARRELSELLLRVDGDRHRALRAFIEWELVTCSNAAGDWGSAARYATSSASLLRSLGNRVDAARVEGHGAFALEMIGETDLAWQLRLRTFATLSEAGETQWLATAVHSAAMTLGATDRTAAAASITDLLAGSEKDPAQEASSQATRARNAARSGDFQRAQQALALARDRMQCVGDPAIRDYLRAQIALAEATSPTNEDPRRAIAALDGIIEVFSRRDARIDLPDAYLQRARARRATGDESGALADYRAALEEVEKQRTTLSGDARFRFLDVATHIIEETVDLRLMRGDIAGAFAVADRARSLIDPQPVTGATSVIPALPPGVLVVEFAVLPKRTIAFCVSSTGIAAVTIPIDRRELENEVSAFAGRIRRRASAEDLRRESAALQRLLIDPLRSHLAGVRELILVPDRQLHALPFAALWNEKTRRYLVEDYTLRFAPSATLSRGLAAAPQQSALVIADPPTATNPPLPASREEAEAIAAMYGGATLLAGETATRSTFIERARRSTLIHFAGHANSDATTSHGALLFAAAGNDSGILASSEVAQLRLERSPLVVLAACGTLRGDALHVAGMSSLSRAFLAAGARGVVGTLWEVEDDVSAPLFRRFHEDLRAGLEPAEALRAAQIDALRSPEPRLAHPATWAPVELLTDVLNR